MGKRTIYFGRFASLRNWLNERSETFSKLCGEDFTHKEVLLCNALLIILMLAMLLAETHILTAVAVECVAFPIVRHLNRE